MKRNICRCLTAAVLVIIYSIPAQAARLLIPVGEVVGLSLSEGTVRQELMLLPFFKK